MKKIPERDRMISSRKSNRSAAVVLSSRVLKLKTPPDSGCCVQNTLPVYDNSLKSNLFEYLYTLFRTEYEYSGGKSISKGTFCCNDAYALTSLRRIACFGGDEMMESSAVQDKKPFIVSRR